MFISVREQNNNTYLKSKFNEMFNELIIELSSIFILNIEFWKKIPLKSVFKFGISFSSSSYEILKQVFFAVILTLVFLKVYNKRLDSLYE